MKRYIVVNRITSTRAGVTTVTYTGKGGVLFRYSNSHRRYLDTARNARYSLAEEYGYKRRQDAMRSALYTPFGQNSQGHASFIMEIDV